MPQSRQNARLFLQSSEFGVPQPPHPQASLPPPLVAHSLAGEGTGGGVPIPTRGQTLWYSRNICMYFVVYAEVFPIVSYCSNNEKAGQKQVFTRLNEWP